MRLKLKLLNHLMLAVPTGHFKFPSFIKNQIVLFKYLVFLLAIHTSCFAQQTDLEFLVSKIKTDYPGYIEKTKPIDFDEFVAKQASAYQADTFRMMAKIIDFFHDRHLDLIHSRDTDNSGLDSVNFYNTKSYFDSKVPKAKYEGYWLNDRNNCIIAIRRIGQKPLAYCGYVIESRDSSLIRPGMVFCEFGDPQKDTFFTKLTSLRSGSTAYVRSVFRSGSVITTGPYNKWKKLKHYGSALLPGLPVLSDMASGKWLNKDSYLIKIPASTEFNGAIVDSLIKANPDITTRAKNLIIDVRNNTGGTVKAFDPLFPLLYTHPIFKVNVSLYCTQDGADNTRKQIQSYTKSGEIDSSYLKNLEALAKLQEDSLGKFVLASADTVQHLPVLLYPRHVAFIINYGCQSATEMMLLDAQQSNKVTFFGERTMGAVDYMDFYPLSLPSGKYQLLMPISRREIPKGGEKLDKKGIRPDVFISDSEKDWVEFVKQYYEKH